jgi:hypothetical protein
MGHLPAWCFGGSQLERLTVEVESAARNGRIDARLAQVGRQAADGRGRAARLAGAVTDLLQALARTQERERRTARSAIQGLHEPLTAIRAHVQVLRQLPELPQSARASLLADLDGEVAQLSVDLDALAALVREPAPADQRS